MTQPSNVASLEVYSLAASEPNKPRNFLWSADVNINASLHLVILFKSMDKAKAGQNAFINCRSNTCQIYVMYMYHPYTSIHSMYMKNTFHICV